MKKITIITALASIGTLLCAIIYFIIMMIVNSSDFSGVMQQGFDVLFMRDLNTTHVIVSIGLYLSIVLIITLVTLALLRKRNELYLTVVGLVLSFIFVFMNISALINGNITFGDSANLTESLGSILSIAYCLIAAIVVISFAAAFVYGGSERRKLPNLVDSEDVISVQNDQENKEDKVEATNEDTVSEVTPEEVMDEDNEVVAVKPEQTEEVSAKTDEKVVVETEEKVKKAPAKKSTVTSKKAPAKKSISTTKKTTEKTTKAPEDDAHTASKTGTKIYHVSKHHPTNKWQVKLEGGKKAIKTFDTQREAQAYANDLIESNHGKGALKLHSRKGTIRKADNIKNEH